MKGAITLATFRTTIVLGLRLLVQAGTLLIVARLLGPHDYSTFAGITSLAMMLGTLSTFGTHIVLLAEVSREPSSRSVILPFAMSTTLLCGGLLLGAYTLLASFIPNGSGISTGIKLAIGVAELLLLPLITLQCAEHQGLGRIATSQLLMTLPLVLRLVVAVTVWFAGIELPLTCYAYGYLAASAIALLAAMFTLQDAWPSPANWRLPTNEELKHAAGYAVLNITAAGPTELDKTLAPRVLAPITAGIYSAGARVIGAATLPVIAMMLAVMPKLFREAHTDIRLTWRFLALLLGLALGYSILLDAALWLAAPLFDWLFGPRYAGMHHAIRWLCLAVPGLCLRITLGTVLMSLKHPWLRASFEIAGLITLSITALTLAPKFGMAGMASALACSEWSMTIIGGAILVILVDRSRPHTRSSMSNSM